MFFVQNQMWARLGREKSNLLIIGAGINGAGVAREAARRGLSVACVEQNDVASGTSSRSSKLIHGGLRYLEQAELHLVFEAVSERRVLLDVAPHLVKPLGFLFPIYKSSRIPLPIMYMGMWLYEGLAKFDSPNPPHRLSPDDVHRVQPALSTDEMTGASLYFDASTDDARLTLENAIDAVEQGAIVSTWTKVVSLIKGAEGNTIGARVRNQLTGEEKEVYADVVVNTSGPWTDEVLGLDSGYPPHLLRPTKGVHIALSAYKLPIQYAVLLLHPDDQRVMFVIPWGDLTYVGTTDTDYDGDPGDVYADATDVAYLLRALDVYFPASSITSEDIISTWAGLRPLMRPQTSDGHAVEESTLSREHQIVVSKSGIVSLAGGKLTTYRLMAIETVDKVVELLRRVRAGVFELHPSNTALVPLPGARNWPIVNRNRRPGGESGYELDEDEEERRERCRERLVEEVVLASGVLLSDWCAESLVNYYGTRAIMLARFVYIDPSLGELIVAHRPEIMAQVTYAVAYESCATVSDFMMQRTQLYFRSADQGLSGVEKVADKMQSLLKWSDAQKEKYINDYRAIVSRANRWRVD